MLFVIGLIIFLWLKFYPERTDFTIFQYVSNVVFGAYLPDYLSLI
jgi:hypothetical protein